MEFLQSSIRPKLPLLRLKGLRPERPLLPLISLLLRSISLQMQLAPLEPQEAQTSLQTKTSVLRVF